MLKIDRVSAGYDRGQVLHDVSLEVEPGEVVALLGRNGAGKTTLLRTVMGMTNVLSGDIRFNGDGIRDESTWQIARSGIAYVPESREAFSLLSVRENLELAASGSSRWDLGSVLRWFPGLKPLLGRKGNELSGGQQQMMVIGRGLMTGPRLLMLDEPTQGLAPVIVKDVMAMIKQLKRDKLSILLVEQSVSVAFELADRIYIMSSGKINLETLVERGADRASEIERLMASL